MTKTLWVDEHDLEHAALLVAAYEHHSGFHRLCRRMQTDDGRVLLAVGAVREE